MVGVHSCLLFTHKDAESIPEWSKHGLCIVLFVIANVKYIKPFIIACVLSVDVLFLLGKKMPHYH